MKSVHPKAICWIKHPIMLAQKLSFIPWNAKAICDLKCNEQYIRFAINEPTHMIDDIDKKTHYVTNFLKIKVFSINSINLFFLEVYVMILSERRCSLYAKNNTTKT